MSSPTSHPDADGAMGLAVSNHVIKMVSEYTGRGPTRGRTHFSENLVTVVLRDLLTRGERSLMRDGESDLVLAMRRAFQDKMAARLVLGVEDITQRRVVAFMSANHLEPDMAIESFVLADDRTGAL